MSWGGGTNRKFAEDTARLNNVSSKVAQRRLTHKRLSSLDMPAKHVF